MTKRVRLTERQMNKAINEISYGTVDDAYQKDYNLFNSIIGNHERFNDSLKELKSDFKYLENDLYQNDYFNSFNPEKNNHNFNKINESLREIGKYINYIETISDNLKVFLERKESQINNFSNSMLKYDKAHGNDDISWDEYKKGEVNNI